MRVSGEAEELPFFKQLLLAPIANISTMFCGISRVDVSRTVVGLIISAAGFAGFYLLFRRKPFNRDFAVLMLILGAVPYLRYLALSNHSYLHEFFTYRAQAASVLALLGTVWYCSKLSPAPNNGKLSRKKAVKSK